MQEMMGRIFPMRGAHPAVFAADRQAGLKASRLWRYEEALKSFAWAAECVHVEGLKMKHDPAIDAAIRRMARPWWPRRRTVGRSGRLRVAHVHPYFLDNGGHTSGVLGFLAYHDRERFQVCGIGLELVDSRIYGPRALSHVERLQVPYYALSPESSCLDRVRALYRMLDDVDVAVFYPCRSEEHT